MVVEFETETKRESKGESQWTQSAAVCPDGASGLYVLQGEGE